MIRLFRSLVACATLVGGTCAQAAPGHVDITWMSITNMHFDLGSQKIVADGYITRLPPEIFYSGASGYGRTQRAVRPDEAAVKEVLDALGGKPAVNLLVTGHNHFDHSFDTGTWAKLSGARVIGAPTACLQTRAQGIAASRCTPVLGGEVFETERGVHVYVIAGITVAGRREPRAARTARLGDPRFGCPRCPARRCPEDFPNGGGIAYLFTVDGPQGRFSWFYWTWQCHRPARTVVLLGKDYGAARQPECGHEAAARLRRPVDRHRRRDLAALVLPGLAEGLSTGTLGRFVRPLQGRPVSTRRPGVWQCSLSRSAPRRAGAIHDKWRLDSRGIRAVDNLGSRKLGFN
jgi:hypothetical protein